MLNMLPKNLLCFSPVRWDFVMYRPQQLLVRFAEQASVYFFEDPVFDAEDTPYLSYATRSETLWKVEPHLKAGLTQEEVDAALALLLDQLLRDADMDQWIFWYYAPPPLPFTRKYNPRLVIYDHVKPADGNADWNTIFSSVMQQIDEKLPDKSLIDLFA